MPLQDGSDVLQFQRFRVFHPLPKQAHHGILKTLWDKRVQWNQGLNARRTKQLLQAFLDQDVRLGVPSQALPLPATAPRPAVTAAPSTAPAVAAAPVPTPAPLADASAVSRATPVASATTSPAKAPAAAPAGATVAADAAETLAAQTQADAGAAAKDLSSPAKAAAAQSKGSARTQPWLRPRHKRPHTHASDNGAAAVPVASTPVAHEGKGHAGHAVASNSSQEQPEVVPVSRPQQGELAMSEPASPAQHSDSADFDSGTPATTSSQSDATNFESFDLAQAAGGDQFGEGMGEDILPNLPPLHLSKAQHRCDDLILKCTIQHARCCCMLPFLLLQSTAIWGCTLLNTHT